MRALLAGVVRVDLVGRNLAIDGDGSANSVAIDLTARTSDELVTGLNDTTVQFSRDFDNGVNLSHLLNVNIRMRGGNDSVIINGSGSTIPGSLNVWLGTGDDTFELVGSEAQPVSVSRDVAIYGSTGNDSITIAYASIGNNLRLIGAGGNDSLALNGADVSKRSVVHLQQGNDNLLIANGRFDRQVLVLGGSGRDYVAAADSTFSGRLRVYGQSGADTSYMPNSNTFNSSPPVLRAEEQLSEPAQNSQASAVIAEFNTAFNDAAGSLPIDTANLIQDQLSSLGNSFGTDTIMLELDPATQTVSVNDPTPSLSVMWDQAVRQAVVNTHPGPTVASRAYAMLHTAIYGAWSAYDATAVSTQLADNLQRPAIDNTDANKQQAMSYAAYRVLDDLFASETAIFDDLMTKLGFDPANESADGTTPAGIGNLMAAALLDVRHQDGSNQLGDSPDGTAGVPYSNVTAYQPVNAAGDTTVIDRWTPEFVPIDAGPGTAIRTQQFLTPQWGQVTPFALSAGDQFLPTAPEPFLLVDGTVDLAATTITLADNSVLPIDRSLIGTVINPAFVAQAEHVVALSAGLTDEQKLIAEFWEDGRGTSFPPGTFMTFGEFTSARDNHSLDEDAKMFFALGNAVFDAGIATWQAKVEYDYARPVRVIRELGKLGLIGQFNADLGGYAVEAWMPGQGTQTILASEFTTYQTPGSDPSPPFAEYTSGHSAFSAAGATILRLFTGSDDFGASVTFGAGTSRFEPGLTPTAAVTLSWDTFSQAADEAGISRLYGGIHFMDGDMNGRILGREVGQTVWDRTQFFINGGA